MVAVLAGVAASCPIGCYELWMFVAPGLSRREKLLALTVSFWATVLFPGGIVFAYFVALPEVLSFLMNAAGSQLEARPRFDSCLTFVARTVIAFGLAFGISFLMVAAGLSAGRRRFPWRDSAGPAPYCSVRDRHPDARLALSAKG